MLLSNISPISDRTERNLIKSHSTVPSSPSLSCIITLDFLFPGNRSLMSRVKDRDHIPCFTEASSVNSVQETAAYGHIYCI